MLRKTLRTIDMRKLITLLLTLLLTLSLCACDAGKANKDDTSLPATGSDLTNEEILAILAEMEAKEAANQ